MISPLSGQRDQVLWLTDDTYVKAVQYKKIQKTFTETFYQHGKILNDAWGKQTIEVNLQINLYTKSYDTEKDQIRMWKMELNSFIEMTALYY